MRLIKTLKMHCNGNDFIFLDLRSIEQNISTNWSKAAIQLTNRNFGLGGDGLILIEKPVKSSNYIRIYNTNGTEAETCGSAILCSAFYLSEMKKEKKIILNTLNGEKVCYINHKKKTVTVNMGKVIYERDITIIVDNQRIYGFLVNIGNPHFVVLEDKNLFSNEKKLKKIENALEFKNGTNIENITIQNKNKIKIDIWERGVGLTLSCGSGACATAFISHKIKSLDKKITVVVPGGELEVEIHDDDSCNLTGAAKRVFETQIDITPFSTMCKRS